MNVIRNKVLVTIEDSDEKNKEKVLNKKFKIIHLLRDCGIKTNYIDFVNPTKFSKEFKETSKHKLEEYSFLLLSGGGDIGDDVRRDNMELILIDEFLQRNKYILGICRGIQMILHYYGVPVENLKMDKIKHEKILYLNEDDVKQKNFSFHFGTVNLDVFKNFFGEFLSLEKTIILNSRHHQGTLVEDFLFYNTPLKILISSSDGVVEAVINDKILGVQYHPEILSDYLILTEEIFYPQLEKDIVEYLKNNKNLVFYSIELFKNFVRKKLKEL